MKLIISDKWKLVGYRKLPYILRPINGEKIFSSTGSRDIAKHNQKCTNCEYLGDCSGGCRATAVGEEELKRVSGGSATGVGNGSQFITGNIHYWCKTTSKRDDCHDSVLQTSWCWYNDACTLVFYQYNDKEGWHGDLESDY